MYHVIAYYQFCAISNPDGFCNEHKELCRSLELKGRIYIAEEGINGTVAGTPEDIIHYQNRLRRQPGFENTEFKIHTCDFIPFERLIVKVRPEIVTLKVPIEMDPLKEKAEYLTPAQWRQMLESDEDFILLDVRNEYEGRLGHFEGAVIPPLKNFFGFPQWLDTNPLDKNKKILMYCTGGIRCEKLSVLMKHKGFKDVYQLQGGILNYAEKEGGKHFKGRCFVFDDRMSVPVNAEDSDQPIGRCAISGVPCDTYINCANMECHTLFLCSREAAVQMQGCCSDECKKAPTRRPFDVDRFTIPFRRRHQYVELSPVT